MTRVVPCAKNNLEPLWQLLIFMAVRRRKRLKSNEKKIGEVAQSSLQEINKTYEELCVFSFFFAENEIRKEEEYIKFYTTYKKGKEKLKKKHVYVILFLS